MYDINKIRFGNIIRYNKKKFIGIVEDFDGNYFFFHSSYNDQKNLKKEGVINNLHKLCTGDEVQFKIKPRKNDITKFEAYEIIFIRNERRERLIQEANESEYLIGYIKHMHDGKIFIKHVSTYVYIPLEISDWETDLEIVYKNDELVRFKLLPYSEIGKLKAELLEKKFISEYYQLLDAKNNGRFIQGKITGRNSQGFFLTVLDGSINGFFKIPKGIDNIDLNKYINLKRGETVSVEILRFNNKQTLSVNLISDF